MDYFRPELLQSLRGTLADNAARPLFWLTRFPARAWTWMDDTFSSRDTLQERNAALENENLILQRKVQRMASLMAENARLRELLNSTEQLDDSVLVAELLGVSPDRLKQEMLLNRGRANGVFEGQPVLDAYGLVGSVVEVSEHTAHVLLITDSTNAVPVQISRNGVRGIAEGSGRSDELNIRNLVPTTDIKKGDLIVSSGLGGRYPPGYPVGEVTDIKYDDGTDPFMRVVVHPCAQLNRSRQLLLVFRSEAKLKTQPPKIITAKTPKTKPKPPVPEPTQPAPEPTPAPTQTKKTATVPKPHVRQH